MLKPFVADVMGREVRQYLLGSLQCAWQCSGGVILAVAWQCGGVLLAVWVIVRFFVQMFTQSSLAPILFLVSGYEPGQLSCMSSILGESTLRKNRVYGV